ncbi:hypothetical protein TIFTF001_047604 [Ficus carica]|uniref:Uncharacterized protein n=1 Tax=Ficus carica TaxID=3494 RepID=A0AA87ZD43_FICCA|nr:hypothetical protein TIFTF001_047604 [Ficus carica]
MMYVELMKNVKNSDDNDNDGLKVERDGGCNMENDGNIRDEYFNVNMEPPRVYDATSAPGNEGDVLDVPTLEERPNQETTASAPTPKRQRSCVEVDPVMEHCEPLAIDDSSVSFSFDDRSCRSEKVFSDPECLIKVIKIKISVLWSQTAWLYDQLIKVIKIKISILCS